MHTKNQSRKGFTLIETIVSIAILTIAIVGPMTLSARSIHASSGARLQLEATYLANEGIEVVRNLRDNSSAEDNSTTRTNLFATILTTCQLGCIVDVDRTGSGSNVWNPNVIRSCSTGDCLRVYSDVAGTGLLYRQSGNSAPGGDWDVSPFTRMVVATQVTAERQMRLTSTVSYRDTNGLLRQVIAVDDLYNWFPYLAP